MMTPTDIIDKIILYNADCMEVMKQFNDKEFDLAIIDPPYGIESSGKSFGAGSGKLKNRVLNKNSKKIIEWDNKPGDDYFTELFRISKIK